MDGATHAMADVWFAKETSGSHPKPSLGDLLAAPSMDLLPAGSGTGSHGATTATTTDHTSLDHVAHAAALTSAALAAAEEERRRHHAPLI